MKTLEFIYQENEIHFLVNPDDKHVMINATEMAEPFRKKVDNFLRLSGTELFIQELIESENAKIIPSDVRGYLSKDDIVVGRKRGGTLMHRKLALKFAAWLDVKFELWIIDTIDEILFGNYKKHWEAHAMQEQARMEMERLRREMLTKPSIETNRAFFEAMDRHSSAKRKKRNAIRHQLQLFDHE